MNRFDIWIAAWFGILSNFCHVISFTIWQPKWNYNFMTYRWKKHCLEMGGYCRFCNGCNVYYTFKSWKKRTRQDEKGEKAERATPMREFAEEAQ